MTEVVIYTDGAGSGNPWPGGWGAVLRWNGTEKDLHGGELQTTKHRMELMGAISALGWVPRPPQVDHGLTAQRLADGRQEAGQERGPVAPAGCGHGPPRNHVGVGEGPRRG